MNGFSFVGRLSPGFFTHSLGVLNMLAAAAFCCTILIFAVIEYSLFSCSSVRLFRLDYVSVEMTFKVSMSYSSVTTLQASSTAYFISHNRCVSELGYVVI